MLALRQLGELAATCYQPPVADINHELEIAEKISSNDGQATGASRKFQVNYLVRVCTVNVRWSQQVSGVPLVVMRRGPVGAAGDLWGIML